MSTDLRAALRDAVAAAPPDPADLRDVIDIGTRRVRRRTALTVAASVVLAGVVAGLLTVPDRDDRVAPVEPGPVRNGAIIHSPGFAPWQGPPPPPTAGSPHPVWYAFDQDTESFLHVSPYGRVFVVGPDGPTAEFDCPPGTNCGREGTFGPGPDELTMPARDGRSAQVLASDGTVRETLDLSAVLTGGQSMNDLAWSPDGSRLAVATNHDVCDPEIATCEATVWIFDRDSGEAQRVHTRATPGDRFSEQNHEIVVLAWSPDGRSLGLVKLRTFVFGAAAAARRFGPPAGLVVLRFQPGQPVRADELFAYDCGYFDPRCRPGTDFFLLNFAFAWSPDGTRIAVNTQDGIAEISAEDGRVLARHPGKGVLGPLAWLRER